MKVICFNGPPRSGKDTLAHALLQRLELNGKSALVIRFSEPIKRALGAILGQQVDVYNNLPGIEDTKDFVHPLFGVSLRQWQIDYSEKFMKPLYGADIFGRILSRRLAQYENANAAPDVWLIADCGFQVEVDYLRKFLSTSELALYRVIREGTSFEGDSRQFVHLPPPYLDFGIYNNSTPEAAVTAIMKDLAGWL